MPVNVRPTDRDQQFLMPPSVADWLPEDHLAWFIIDVVAELDIAEFYAAYREDGRGGAAYDPAMLLGVLLYAYCVGERSSRRIEKRLRDDVAFRVVAANQDPDHATLARFRRRHEQAIADLFSQVLGLCVQEGLVASGIIAIDGTKMEADASSLSNRTRRQLADEILAEAERTDATEDEALGTRRGDELPDRLAPGADRRARLREALRQLDAQEPADYEALMARRAIKEAELGRKLKGRKPSPTSPRRKDRKTNTTDPDSRTFRSGTGYLQGYNAQAAVSAEQVIVAAEVTNSRSDTTMFIPMVCATKENLNEVGAPHPGVFLADAGYWSTDNLDFPTGAEVLIPPMPNTSSDLKPDDPSIARRAEVLARVETGSLTPIEAADELGISLNWAHKLLANRHNNRGDPAVHRQAMLARLDTDEARALYAKRKISVEPVFGNIKANLRCRRFNGRGMKAVSSEWRFICAVHNLMKLRTMRLANG